jgi:hypothetical protein
VLPRNVTHPIRRLFGAGDHATAIAVVPASTPEQPEDGFAGDPFQNPLRMAPSSRRLLQLTSNTMDMP